MGVWRSSADGLRLRRYDRDGGLAPTSGQAREAA